MSDVQQWIEERRTIHAEAGDGRWEKRLHEHDYEVWAPGEYDDVPVSSYSAGPDATAIVDAHNMFPRALDALQKVLDVHRKVEEADESFDVTFCPACLERWPCETVEAIEGAISGERG